MTHRLNSMQAHPSRFEGYSYQPRHADPNSPLTPRSSKLGYAVAKVTAVGAVAATAVLALAGCSANEDPAVQPQTREHNVRLEDDSEVTCIMFDEFDSTSESSYDRSKFQLQAVDCDWAHRRAGVNTQPDTTSIPRETPTITLTPEPNQPEEVH